MIQLNTPIYLDLTKPVKISGGEWRRVKDNILMVYGQVLSADSSTSVIGDQSETTQTLTVRIRYTPTAFEARSAKIGELSYRITACIDPDFKRNYLNLVLVSERK